MRALNLTLLTDLYELTMMQGYFKNPTDQIVVLMPFTEKIHVTEDMPLRLVWIRSSNISGISILLLMILIIFVL